MVDSVDEANRHSRLARQASDYARAESTPADQKAEWLALAIHNAKHGRDMHTHQGNTAEARELHAVAAENFHALVQHHHENGNHEVAANLLASEGYHHSAARAYHDAAKNETNDMHRRLDLLNKALGNHAYSQYQTRQNPQNESDRNREVANIHGHIIYANTALQAQAPDNETIARHARAKLNSHLWLADYHTKREDHAAAQRHRDQAIDVHNDIRAHNAKAYLAEEPWHRAARAKLHKQSYAHYQSPGTYDARKSLEHHTKLQANVGWFQQMRNGIRHNTGNTRMQAHEKHI